MHSGFGALRSHFPMNIEASLPDVGQLVLRDKPAVRAELNRLCTLWESLLAEHGGPLLFGQFTVADAYFAPVVMRLKTYAVPVPPVVAAYMDAVCALPGVQRWVEGALAEHDFLDFEEPYRLRR
jgi:glutathione S-transferase